MSTQDAFRIVVADDSSLYRHIVKKVLNLHPGLEVVEVAADGAEAVEATRRHRPDGVVLDVNMPKMNGFEALERILVDRRIPVVMISAGAVHDAQLAVQAAARGAVDLFVKPAAEAGRTVTEGLKPLAELVYGACEDQPGSSPKRGRPAPAVPSKPSPRQATGSHRIDIIAIGSSTGGVQHLAKIVARLPAGCPPVVVCQHMPAGFTQTLAKQLDAATNLSVVESSDGQPLRPGHVYICAADDSHTLVRRGSRGVVLERDTGAKEHHQRPAVDPLLRSVAATFGEHALGVILTGMGRDGAQGLLAMRRVGARTVAESQETAIVFGMPKAAIDLGAATEVLNLEQITEVLAAHTVSSGERRPMESTR